MGKDLDNTAIRSCRTLDCPADVALVHSLRDARRTTVAVRSELGKGAAKNVIVSLVVTRANAARRSARHRRGLFVAMRADRTTL